MPVQERLSKRYLQLQNLCTLRVIKRKIIKWAQHIPCRGWAVCMHTKFCLGKGLLGRLSRICEDNIKMDFLEQFSICSCMWWMENFCISHTIWAAVTVSKHYVSVLPSHSRTAAVYSRKSCHNSYRNCNTIINLTKSRFHAINADNCSGCMQLST